MDELNNGIKKLEFKQSANTLFKFMKKLDYLTEIIENSAIIPRYNVEVIDYLDLKNIREIAYPMSCFCDINLTKLHMHTEDYGNYGIGLKKQYVYENIDIEPIHYVNSNSNEIKDFKTALNTAFNDKSNEKLKNYLTTSLIFMKPIEGKMYKTENDEKVLKRFCFHDEKEWRYIPSINTRELPMVLVGENLTESYINTCNSVLKTKDKYWIKFPINEISYLIVGTEKDSIDLSKFIYALKKYNKEEKMLLISKIIILKDLERDW